MDTKIEKQLSRARIVSVLGEDIRMGRQVKGLIVGN